MFSTKHEKSRFDARLTREQKQYFERAARLVGYRSLKDFVILTVQERANEIIEKTEQIIASEEDRTIFFNALMNPEPPNSNLINAHKDYKKLNP